MKVAELIEALKDKDADAEVYIGREWLIYSVTDIKNILDWRQNPTGDIAIVAS